MLDLVLSLRKKKNICLNRRNSKGGGVTNSDILLAITWSECKNGK